MIDRNFMTLQFAAKSENESFARVTVAAFMSQLDPTMDELTDMKTVVSEAVTNAIIHGYDGDSQGVITITSRIEGDMMVVSIEDQGKGIDNLDEARQPLYTSKPELERSGMGFTIMENFMDHIEVVTAIGKGTKVTMQKRIENKKAMYN